MSASTKHRIHLITKCFPCRRVVQSILMGIPVISADFKTLHPDMSGKYIGSIITSLFEKN